MSLGRVWDVLAAHGYGAGDLRRLLRNMRALVHTLSEMLARRPALPAVRPYPAHSAGAPPAAGGGAGADGGGAGADGAGVGAGGAGVGAAARSHMRGGTKFISVVVPGAPGAAARGAAGARGGREASQTAPRAAVQDERASSPTQPARADLDYARRAAARVPLASGPWSPQDPASPDASPPRVM